MILDICNSHVVQEGNKRLMVSEVNPERTCGTSSLPSRQQDSFKHYHTCSVAPFSRCKKTRTGLYRFPDIIYQLCRRTNPSPLTKDDVRQWQELLFDQQQSMSANEGAELRQNFASTKAWSRSGNHWNTAFFDRRGRKGIMIVVSSFEKLPSWFTNPNHERRSVMISGDFSRSGLAWMPVLDRRNSPKSTSETATVPATLFA